MQRVETLAPLCRHSENFTPGRSSRTGNNQGRTQSSARRRQPSSGCILLISAGRETPSARSEEARRQSVSAWPWRPEVEHRDPRAAAPGRHRVGAAAGVLQALRELRAWSPTPANNAQLSQLPVLIHHAATKPVVVSMTNTKEDTLTTTPHHTPPPVKPANEKRQPATPGNGVPLMLTTSKRPDGSHTTSPSRTGRKASETH